MSEMETPWERWSRDVRPLRHMTEEELVHAFVAYLERTVTSDRVVSIDSIDYEIPREAGRGGQTVLIAHRLLEATYHVVVGERLVRIHPVDLAANARSPRARPGAPDETKTPPEKTAADMVFDRDLGSVLDEDGGAPPPSDPPEEEKEEAP